MIQLMKIRLLLGMVGVGFSYSLIILRSSLNDPTENGYLRIQDQKHVAIQMDKQNFNNGGSALLITPPSDTCDVIIPGLMPILKRLRRTHPRVVMMLWNNLKEYLRDEDKIRW